MGSLPASNALLTSIQTAGFTEDYDEPSGAGTAKWSGSEGCYVVDKIRTALGPDGLNRIKTTYLVVPADVGAGVSSGDLAVFVKDGATVTGTVWEVEVAKIAGTARLHLQDAKIA